MTRPLQSKERSMIRRYQLTVKVYLLPRRTHLTLVRQRRKDMQEEEEDRFRIHPKSGDLRVKRVHVLHLVAQANGYSKDKRELKTRWSGKKVK